MLPLRVFPSGSLRQVQLQRRMNLNTPGRLVASMGLAILRFPVRRISLAILELQVGIPMRVRHIQEPHLVRFHLIPCLRMVHILMEPDINSGPRGIVQLNELGSTISIHHQMPSFPKMASGIAVSTSKGILS